MALKCWAFCQEYTVPEDCFHCIYNICQRNSMAKSSTVRTSLTTRRFVISRAGSSHSEATWNDVSFITKEKSSRQHWPILFQSNAVRDVLSLFLRRYGNGVRKRCMLLINCEIVLSCYSTPAEIMSISYNKRLGEPPRRFVVPTPKADGIFCAAVPLKNECATYVQLFWVESSYWGTEWDV